MRVLLAALLFLLVSCSGDPRTPKQRVRQDVGSSVVRIFGVAPSGQRSGGTGFSVKAPSGKRYLLTNKHVCALADQTGRLEVEFPNLSRKYKRRIIEISSEHDLCLVESLPSFKTALSVSKGVITGEGIYVVGHPKLYALTVAEGEFIENTVIRVAMSKGTEKPVVVPPYSKTDRMKSGGWFPTFVKFKSSRFSVYSRGGNSGSPIVNFNGQVISVLFAGNRADVMETYGVPLDFVQRFLAGY